jgi:undecaprenyl-diphosphatase
MGAHTMANVAQFIVKWDSLMVTRMPDCLLGNRFVRAIQWVSRGADGHAYPAILVPAALLQSHRWKILAACILSFAIELIAYKAIKQRVKRPRPFHALAGLVNLIAPQDVFSFPSGHTAGAFVAAVLIGYCYPAGVLPLYVWALLVGFSRIYLRVHYPSDVLAGACLGILSAKAGLLLANSLF